MTHIRTPAPRVSGLAAWITCITLWACAAPPASTPEEDWSGFGTLEQVLQWSPEQQLRGYRHMDRLYPTRVVRAGQAPYPLGVRAVDLTDLRYSIDGVTFDLEGFIADTHVVGLLIIQDEAVVLERYARGQTPDTKWYSFSVAKSMLSLLMGAALRDGYLSSLDASVTGYLPILLGSAYEGVTLRHVLQMSSGVAWREVYDDPASDIARTGGSALDRLRYLAARPRVAEPGRVFNYNTEETNLLGAVLRTALGNSLSTYLETTIWRPFGMADDAHWVLLSDGGAEHGGCCLSATLRDYGHLGVFALREGRLADGTRVLPEGWMRQSTAPSPTIPNYGQLWWRRDHGAFAALGIYGQMLYVDPARRLVIVIHSVWPRATDPELSAHREAFIAAVASAVETDVAR